MVKYTYDAWGKVLSTTGSLASTLGTVQPFRYRGYVYDVETGLYYLRSRYYSPFWSRFINADALFYGNLFTYCYDNPVLFVDRNGNTATLANNIVNLKKGPSDGSDTRFTIKNARGAACEILFTVYDQQGNPVWLYIMYKRKQNDEYVGGYVKKKEILFDKEDISTTLPTLSSIDSSKSYSTLTTQKKTYKNTYIKDDYTIYCMQCVLYSHGYLDSIAYCDGQYGPKTTAAVREFQRFYNDPIPDFDADRLIKEDGIWGPRTYQAMKNIYGY